MKFSKEIPPIYAKLHVMFGVNWSDGLVITYGDTVYCASDLSEDLKVHEGVHVIQQEKMDKDVWWDKYLSDVKFRLEQETAAYLAQAQYIKANMNRHDRRSRLHKIADDMVRMYGGMCSKEQAEEILKSA